MRKIPFMVLVALAVTMTSAGPVAQQTAQQTAQKAAQLAGTWDVHIEHYGGRIVDEQWVVTQDGAKVTGKVVLKSGATVPIEGPIDGNTIKWKVTTRPASSPEGERFHHFIGTVSGTEIKGTLERPDHSDDGTFIAKRGHS